MSAFVLDLGGETRVHAQLIAEAKSPVLGVRLTGVLVDHVRVGDFTTFTGYRRVTAVHEVTETRGRGSKKRTRTVAWLLGRVDGTFDRLDVGTTLTVFAP